VVVGGGVQGALVALTTGLDLLGNDFTVANVSLTPVTVYAECAITSEAIPSTGTSPTT
jgi:hypothetical protein